MNSLTQQRKQVTMYIRKFTCNTRCQKLGYGSVTRAVSRNICLM